MPDPTGAAAAARIFVYRDDLFLGRLAPGRGESGSACRKQEGPSRQYGNRGHRALQAFMVWLRKYRTIANLWLPMQRSSHVRFGSKADIKPCPYQCPLYPRKRTLQVRPRHVRFVPTAAIYGPYDDVRL